MEKPDRELTLDPDDWDAMRALGHTMVDDMLTFLEDVRDRPVWRPVPPEVRAAFETPVPQDPIGPDRAYEDFRRFVLPYPLGNIHPRFWGWVMGTGTPFGMLAEMLSAGLNSNLFGAEQAPVHVEAQTLAWLKDMVGYPTEASGLLVSGASMANLVALTVARNTSAPHDVVRDGMAASGSKMRIYASTETHSSILKCSMMLGLGTAAVRMIPVDDAHRIRLPDLRDAIAGDRAAGAVPFCVVGNAGTVNTGAFDDLSALADLCRQERLWFHVDGAFGAMAALLPELLPLVKGMERADSLAFDLHKWMFVPYEAGCVFVADPALERTSFNLAAEYLTHTARGVASAGNWFSELGPQLSRSFRALKIWMSLKEHGVRRYADIIQQNIEQARYLAELISRQPELELLAPVALNIVCFRFRGPDDGSPAHVWNDLNREILMQLQESGIAVPSSTTLPGGRFAIRVAITNHRSRKADFECLVQAVLDIGRQLRPCQQNAQREVLGDRDHSTNEHQHNTTGGE